MSSSATPLAGSFAYPFPRFASAPQTPQYVPVGSLIGDERTSSPAPEKPRPHVTRWSICAIGLLTMIIVFWMRSHVKEPRQTDRIPYSPNDIEDYFSHFEGHQDCAIASKDIYVSPMLDATNGKKPLQYCKNRARLLEAMNGGGRHGFDTPYFPVGCHYRWYSTTEICMILERFDTIVFIGDDSLRYIYSAFNMLLRENIALGSLKQWEMKESEREMCRCENQLIKIDCTKYAVMDSESVKTNDAGSGHSSPYYCDRTPHIFIPIDASPAKENLHNTFSSILNRDHDSYKPIPVVHSLSLSTSLSWPMATSSMDEWVTIADITQRNTPFLWVGPNAAGHLKPPNLIMNQGNNALWHYTVEMAKEANSRQLDALGMYNLTLQAGSWDGSYYGQKVALVQAMMVRCP
ncbi:MAG: hypothetical protein Q9167_004662 [Letrouitia subvulpina]